MKQLFILPVILLFFFIPASAQQSLAIESSAVAVRPLVHGDSLTATPSAPAISSRKGFRDLFENDQFSNGPKLNPRAISFVQDYIEKNSDDLEQMKDWGRPYFNVMDAVLLQHHLPKELKYLAVIESRLHTSAVSWAGAVGPWQLMPGTARLLGLKVSRKKDERTNYIKSTHAAARYLADLYDEFGDWLLVIAAYNCGPGNVLKAIARSGSRNFWDLQYFLPAESRNHVKKFIGTHYIFEGQGGLTTLTKKETDENYGVNGTYIFNRRLSPEELKEAATVTISGKYHGSVLARNLMMDQPDFDRYNPDFDKVMAGPENSYEIKLPPGKMELFTANRYQILNESIQYALSSAASAAEAAKDSTQMVKKVARK